MKDARFPKFVVFVNALVPLALLCWDAYHGRLGANPANFALNTTGMLALIFLVLSLTVTPARKISGWNFLSHFRRMLGLYAFFYACLHFSLYFIFDRGLDVGGALADVWKRRFILFGMTGLVSMIPLAITSTNASIKRLGAKKWKRLHQLAYVAGVAAVVHFWMKVKADHTQPGTFAAALGILLGYRVFVALRSKPRAATRG